MTHAPAHSKLDCNGCGASLTVAETTRFATCGDCASRLEIKRSGGAIYSEVLDTGVVALKQELARLEAAPVSSSAPAAGESGGESILRIVVGAVLVASDIYWWISSPSLQSLYIRIVILAAGAWLVLSGAWRAIINGRARLRAMTEAHAAVDVRRKELKRVIAADAKASSDAKP